MTVRYLTSEPLLTQNALLMQQRMIAILPVKLQQEVIELHTWSIKNVTLHVLAIRDTR